MEMSLIGSILVGLLLESLLGVSAFEVYWNIPTFMCKQHRIEFSNLVPKFGIRQNSADKFQGEKIAILYDPGAFPALFNSITLSSKIEKRNGGVPQEGNLTQHLEIYRKVVDELVPDENHEGLVIIDFESWRPIFRQNFGALQSYKDLSYQIEEQRHPFWLRQRQEAEAEKRFECAGRKFVEETLKLSKNLRPNAKWGYYAFPYCFNKGLNPECPANVKRENDRIGWMFFHEDLILPSVYLHEKISFQERQSMVKGRLREAVRVSKKYSPSPKPIYVYIRYNFADTRELLTESDLMMVFSNAKDLASGIILWGSSFDLKTRKNCDKLRSYLESTLGPISQSYSSQRISVDLVNDNE